MKTSERKNKSDRPKGLNPAPLEFASLEEPVMIASSYRRAIDVTFAGEVVGFGCNIRVQTDK
ncbi:hypothetical protein [Endozoicomonas numazuensis]|nr:hypothetical protein [Endozoicomonas numazuensis]